MPPLPEPELEEGWRTTGTWHNDLNVNKHRVDVEVVALVTG